MPEDKEKDNLKPAFDETTRKRMHDVVLNWLTRNESKVEPEKIVVPAVKKVEKIYRPKKVAPPEQIVKPVKKEEPVKKSEPVVLDVTHELSAPRPMLLLGTGSSVHRFLVRFFKTAVLAFIGVNVLAAVLVYGFRQTTGVSAFLSNYIPLPYALVGYHPILYSQINADVEALTIFYGQQVKQNVVQPTPDEIRHFAITALTRRTVAEELARQRGIWVSENDIDDALDKVVEQAGSIDNIKATTKQLWGWEISDYRYYVLRPYLFKQKLLVALQADPIIKRELPAGSTTQTLDRYLDKITPTLLRQVGP